jgi:hypothetical protein
VHAAKVGGGRSPPSARASPNAVSSPGDGSRGWAAAHRCARRPSPRHVGRPRRLKSARDPSPRHVGRQRRTRSARDPSPRHVGRQRRTRSARDPPPRHVGRHRPVVTYGLGTRGHDETHQSETRHFPICPHPDSTDFAYMHPRKA